MTGYPIIPFYQKEKLTAVTGGKVDYSGALWMYR
jgi:hypothetical protein